MDRNGNQNLPNLSAIHKLNPHRKVAVSPEQLNEMEEKLKSLETSKDILQKDFDQTKLEHSKMHRFLSDLLYTLCSRGYETITDHEGKEINLFKCKGDTLLELRGRDTRQRTVVRRMTPQETLMKAYIGNMEKTIQSLSQQLQVQAQGFLIGVTG